jgi:hypothetical protein
MKEIINLFRDELEELFYQSLNDEGDDYQSREAEFRDIELDDDKLVDLLNDAAHTYKEAGEMVLTRRIILAEKKEINKSIEFIDRCIEEYSERLGLDIKERMREVYGD